MSRILSSIGSILVLIGGIIIVIYGFLGLLGTAFLIFTPILFLGGIAYSIVEILIGIICIIGARYVSTIVWGIVLLILGIIAGNIGGSLVVLGAILGLISTVI